MRKFFILFFLLVCYFSFSQTQDAWVFFTDKENVQQSIDNPITILTQAAIDRKALHNIPIDERDVPVNENYITQIKNQPGITVYAKSKWMNCVYVRGTQSNIDNLLNLSFVNSVEFADKSLNFTSGIQPVPDKFMVEDNSRNFNYGFAANQIEMIKGDYLHDEGYTGAGMIIAVLDSGFTGVDTQQGFAYIRDDNRILGVYDFVNRSVSYGNHTHGTRVLSTMGGLIDNQYAGTAPDASYYLFVTEDVSSETPVEEAYWVEALERADSLGVHVVNTSLGYRAYDNPAYSHSYQDLDGQTTFAARGGNHAFDKGMLLVTSAGNSGNGSFPWIGTPGDAPGVFTIGAVNGVGEAAGFSSQGPTVDGRVKPDVMAQGAAAYVINQNNEIVANNGTSFSSPIMAGAIACLWQARPEYTNAQIMQLVRESAHLFNNPTDKMGYGIPNFQIALETLLSVDSYTKSDFLIYPNPVINQLHLLFPENIDSVQAEIYNMQGVRVLNFEVKLSQSSLDLKTLPIGMYLLNLHSSQHSQTFKIIKK